MHYQCSTEYTAAITFIHSKMSRIFCYLPKMATIEISTEFALNEMHHIADFHVAFFPPLCVCVASAVQYNIQFKCLYGLHHQLDMRLNLITWITFRWIFCVQFSPGWYALCLNAILCTDNIYSSSATLVHSFQTLNVLHIYSSVQKYARITLLWMNRLTNERQPQTEIQKPSSCRF